MPVTTAHSAPSVVPYRTTSARLALRQVTSSLTPAGPDGAWWPRTHDLASELCELADVLDPLWGRITHVAANPRHWSHVPRTTVLVNDHDVRIDWFAPGVDPHRILLQSYSAGRWDLLVVPPGTFALAAARLMAAASAGPEGLRRPWPRG
ncbi:DUF5994 family protein [Streptomyces luteogriseus]|uniref:DUF5994 family protein n=1 Tax=Streptomyces luteogriseus TaxID=68233 RepID=UPI0033E92A31